MCDNEQHFLLLDFDDVKDCYCSLHHRESCASVDGFGNTENCVYLIEIKGWKDFLYYNSKNVEQKIKKQVDRFDLQKKFLDSLSICLDISENEAFFSENKVVYVIVTDIETQKDGLKSFQANLQMLSQTSSDWESVCNRLMKEKIAKIQGVETYYKTCQNLDAFLCQL